MTEKVKITILIDNTALPGYIAEHGFSLWLQTETEQILFDAGSTGEALLKNARKAGLNLETIQHLVISHGHYDHTGGIPELLSLAKKANVYCHPDISLLRYSIRENYAKKISIPPASKTALIQLPENKLHLVTRLREIVENIELSGPIPRETTFEDTGGPFYFDKEGKKPDLISDELVLIIKTEKGLIILTGCAHSGLINVLNWIQQNYPKEKIHTIIGGFHLLNASEKRMQRTIEELKKIPFQQLIACHCTGKDPMKKLEKQFPKKVKIGKAGKTYSF